ncbi:homeodomain-interacting protein kinase 1-like [Xyrichtys novacula]|uniref:Homeodomain-interacting protein kinase 1-like n=1 Tax=Xyrichtys novacula TaxID=13765 RepID=A0AAV1FLG5_XYRNO|nr:homeodomain-interacting protein kinase 1-like [Xyrichtys novacula]
MSDFRLATGSEIFSRSTTYTVQSILGQGSFSTIAKCTNIKGRVLDSDKSNILQWDKAFTDRGHFCLAFEHFDKSLHDFMKEKYLESLLLREIRPIIQQVANALDHLKTIGMIHADLKLDNVMLVDHEHQPYKVKVIDFGLAGDVSATRLGSNIQTHPFRLRR